MSLMNLFATKDIVRIQEDNVRKRYQLICTSSFVMGNINFSSKFLLQWDLFLHEINNDGYKFSLLTLEHSLLDSDSPALQDMFQATKSMMQMFSEVQVSTDFKGQILEIHNQSDIAERRKRLGKQFISLDGGVSMKAEQIYNIPEEDIMDKNLLAKRIQAMEFFTVFFTGIYGYNESGKTLIKRKNIMQNFSYDLQLTKTREENYNEITIMVKGQNISKDNRELKKVFAEMPFVISNEIEFNCEYIGKINFIESSGWIKNSDITIKEFISPTLSSTIRYELKLLE
jgi:hypothetical protein